jgi:hypothetical protein
MAANDEYFSCPNSLKNAIHSSHTHLMPAMIATRIELKWQFIRRKQKLLKERSLSMANVKHRHRICSQAINQSTLKNY